MVRRLRGRADKAGRAGKVGRADKVNRAGKTTRWKILLIHPPSPIMHRFRRFLHR